MPPLYVSFYTPEYRDEARELQKTLDGFGLESDVTALCAFPSWERACGFKPQYLRLMRAAHPHRALVWLDADARVRQYPDLFDRLAGVDFAAHWKDDRELLSGTLYFGPSAIAGWLIEQWAMRCDDSPQEWDQKILQQAVADLLPSLKLRRLPAPYTLIFDTMAADGPPVIEHLQASRRLRH